MANTKISHNGEVIAEVNGGQTATLKCAGTKMLGDVVVDVAETKLQAKTAIENGEVTPDAGYDGLSKVMVNVPGEVVEEYDGTITVTGEPIQVEAVEEYDGTITVV